MVSSIHIGCRHCRKKTISFVVNYKFRSKQLNSKTVIFVVNAELIDGGKVKNQWYIRVFVPITKASLVSFYNFLDRFIQKVLITNFVLSSIGAFVLIKFINKINQIDFKQQQTSVYILTDIMFSKGITFLAPDDFCFNASSNNKPYLHLFRFKQDDKEFVTEENVSRELGPNYISFCFKLNNEVDI